MNMIFMVQGSLSKFNSRGLTVPQVEKMPCQNRINVKEIFLGVVLGINAIYKRNVGAHRVCLNRS